MSTRVIAEGREGSPRASDPSTATLAAGPLAWATRGVQVSVLAFACGFPLSGHFGAGYVLQLLALVLLLPAWRLLDKDQPLFWAIVLGIVIAPLPLLVLQRQPPIYSQVVFFVLSVSQVFISVRLAPLVDWRSRLRAPVNLSAFILLATAAAQFVAQHGQGLLSLYFVDKSHAVVAATCVAFLVLWVNEGFFRIILAILVFGVAAATASRLILFGAPFFGLAVLPAYRRSRREASSALAVYFHHLLLLVVPALAIALVESPLLAYLLQRLSGSTTAGSLAAASNSGHVALAQMAMSLKLHDPLTLLLGVGSGGFDNGVRSLHISTTAFAHSDPGGYNALINNLYFVPIHSVPLTIIVEYPLWVAFAFFVLWWQLVRRLWRRRESVMLCMAGALFAESGLYSTHDQYFYWVAVSILCLVAFGNPRRGSTSPCDG